MYARSASSWRKLSRSSLALGDIHYRVDEDDTLRIFAG